MDDIEKAAREGKPLTDKMIRAAGRTEGVPGKVEIEQHDRKVIAEEDAIEADLQAEHDARRAKINKESLKRSTTCIKGSDLDTLKPFWSVWTNGREVLRLDPDAVQDLITHHGADALPPEIAALIEWMEQLFKKRTEAKSATLAGMAPFAQVAGNPAINPNASA